MKMVFWGLLTLFVALQAYIRLAPTDPVRWHVDPFAAQDPAPSGAKVLLPVPLEPDEALTRLAAVAETEPRTRHVAGTVEEGRITYRTRSAFWGFPDFTTIAARKTEGGSEIVFLARARFGNSDLGVNGKRVEAWREAAGL